MAFRREGDHESPNLVDDRRCDGDCGSRGHNLVFVCHITPYLANARGIVCMEYTLAIAGVEEGTERLWTNELPALDFRRIDRFPIQERVNIEDGILTLWHTDRPWVDRSLQME